ncbi:MAG TPA: 3-isopropylmalate dehydratase large subunit [Burkholderiales bacterium]|jgi:3-isopropylmalate/(R)-2-methylmalate dehydratase large subunit|nr:3-isopropylmalate dehydratase large subunit [Burkholderiales bacterium]
MSGKALFEKIWDSHLIAEREGGEALLYVDRNVVHEGPFYAFDALAREKRQVHRPLQTIAFSDHYVPTTARALGAAGIKDGEARVMVEQLGRNSRATGIIHFGLQDEEQGIMHVAGPELGLCEPGMLMGGADSHTSTNGAFGLFGFGVGASQVKHILATQTLWFARPKNMRVTVDGALGPLVSGKDLILAIIAHIGIDGGIGHVIEYAGAAIRALSMEGRMTVCNMSIEAGARSGMICPDQTTYDYLAKTRYGPKGEDWKAALAYWKTLPTDADAQFDREVRIDGNALEPMVTWGTNQDEAIGISGLVPDPGSFADPARRERAAEAQAYMRIKPGTAMRDIAVDRVFIGSCTNARIEDLRIAATLAQGKKARVPTIVVPGSMSVKREAEREGLHEIFLAAGFEWRDAGCSMCTGSNGDKVPSGERCASTSNRNFEGRQGRGSMTHLVSPASAVAAAITGRLADAREIA